MHTSKALHSIQIASDALKPAVSVVIPSYNRPDSEVSWTLQTPDARRGACRRVVTKQVQLVHSWQFQYEFLSFIVEPRHGAC